MRNDSGKTPLDLAHEFDKRDIVSFLEMLPGNTIVLNVTTSNPRSQNSLLEFIERDAIHLTMRSNRCIAHRGAGVLTKFTDYSIAARMSTIWTKYFRHH